MLDSIGLDDIKDIELVELMGEKLSGTRAQAVRTAITAERGILEGSERRYVRATAEMEGLKDREDPGSAFPIFKGSVGYLVTLTDAGLLATDAESDSDSDFLVGIMWPFLRSGLVEQASRLGVQRIKLPMLLDGKLEPTESSSGD